MSKGGSMKKLIMVLSAAVVMVGFLMVPAFAVHHGTKCVDRHNGNSDRTICAMVNANDAWFQEKIEGLEDYKASPYGTDPVDIETDYVTLWRCPASGCVVAKYWDGCCGFRHVDVPGNPNVESTAWYDLCQNPNNGAFHTEIRYRLRWTAEPGDPVGQWFIQNSYDSFENACG